LQHERFHLYLRAFNTHGRNAPALRGYLRLLQWTLTLSAFSDPMGGRNAAAVAQNLEKGLFDLVETDLAAAARNKIALIKIGDRGPEREGTTTTIETIQVSDERWYAAFLELARHAARILVVPGESYSLQSEIVHLASNTSLRSKLVLIMPRAELWARATGLRGHAAQLCWEETQRCLAILGIELPSYDSRGGAYTINEQMVVVHATTYANFIGKDFPVGALDLP
jgi:hypothetical protein